jgi:hypothetical protein
MDSYFSKQTEKNNIIRSVKLGNILLRIQNTALPNEICVSHENVSFCFNVRHSMKKKLHYFVHIARLNNEQIHMRFINSSPKYRRCG